MTPNRVNRAHWPTKGNRSNFVEELKINGNFEVRVSEDLAVVVIGKVETPASWIGATIGYLNQADEVYKLKIIVEDGSDVKFYDEEEGS